MADLPSVSMFDDLIKDMVSQFGIKDNETSTFMEGVFAKGVAGRLRKAKSRPNDPFFKAKKREASTLFQAKE